MISGNVMVGQSGGPTAVINSSLVGVFKAAKEEGVKKIYGMRNGIDGLMHDKYVDLEEHITSDMDIELLKRTPSAFLGSCRYKLPDMKIDDKPYKQIFETLKKLDIKYFIYIGGNDSMDTIMKLTLYADSVKSDIRFMGVPKTIDNDLAETDHTPGYGSAAKFVASSMKEIIRDSSVYNIDSVTIVEVMGRNAGWLTAAAALAKGEDCCGADLICLPERPFDADKFLKHIDDVRRKKKTVVAAVSEGIRDKSGEYVCNQGVDKAPSDAFGHKMLAGTAAVLSDLVTRELGIKARGIELNTLQRCSAHIVSRRDISEAYTAGAEAVRAALNGHTGEMIVFRRICNEPYGILTETYDICKIANLEKTVPNEWIGADDVSVSDEFIKYCRPLIIGELEPFVVEGLPRHLVLNN